MSVAWGSTRETEAKPEILILVVILIAATCGCGVNGDSMCQARESVEAAQPLDASVTQFFNVNQLAAERAHWTFRDKDTGANTYFEFYPYDSFGYSTTPGAVMHITKDEKESYWNPGLDAEVWQAESDDGTAVWSPAVIQRRGSNYVTYDMWSTDKWEPYYYVPDEYQKPFFFESNYYAFGKHKSTTEEIAPDHSDEYYSWPWRIGVYTEQVDTPFYKGLAVVSHQCEGTHDEYEEKWKFAPGVGLVEIETIREHGENKALTIQRVQ